MVPLGEGEGRARGLPRTTLEKRERDTTGYGPYELALGSLLEAFAQEHP